MVFTTSSLTNSTFADVARVALGVFRTITACVFDTSFAVAAVFVATTVCLGAGVLQAELAGVAFFVSEAGVAAVGATNFVVGAVAIVQAFYAGLGGGITFGSSVVCCTVFVGATTFLATPVFTDLSFATGGVIGAGFASAHLTELASWARLLVATEWLAARFAQTNLAVATVGVSFTAFLTFAFFADLSKATVFFCLTDSATSSFADLSFVAGVASGASIPTASFLADLAITAGFVGLAASYAFLFLADLSGFALCVVEAAALACAALANVICAALLVRFAVSTATTAANLSSCTRRFVGALLRAAYLIDANQTCFAVGVCFTGQGRSTSSTSFEGKPQQPTTQQHQRTKTFAHILPLLLHAFVMDTRIYQLTVILSRKTNQGKLMGLFRLLGAISMKVSAKQDPPAFLSKKSVSWALLEKPWVHSSGCIGICKDTQE